MLGPERMFTFPVENAGAASAIAGNPTVEAAMAAMSQNFFMMDLLMLVTANRDLRLTTFGRQPGFPTVHPRPCDLPYS